MAYDAKSFGALCDACDLKGSRVVPPELRPGRPLVIGESPGKTETERGSPFVGPSGKELERALVLMGKTRVDVSLTNTILCRPGSGNDLKSYLRRLSRKQKKAEAVGEPAPGNPLECCRVRMMNEVEQAPALILLGATALRTFGARLGTEKGLSRVRGYPLTIANKPALATYHPAFVLRMRRWTETFRSDLSKAFRHASGRLNWVEPEALFNPTLSQLDGYLERFAEAKDWVAVDTETDGLDPETVNLRCVGLATKTFGLACGFQSIENPPTRWNLAPTLARERIRNFFTSYPRLCGLNIQGYDRPVLERHGMPLPDYGRVFDAMIAHHVTDSELPHSLEYLASVKTDAPMWKPSSQEDWVTDRDLHVYCTFDCINTAGLVEPLIAGLRRTDQIRVYQSDTLLTRLCNGMHKAGMRIDPVERERHGNRLRLRIESAKAQAAEISGKNLNLASPDQVREFLYEKLGLPAPDMETDAGEYSTNRDALYELLQMGLSEKARRFIDALIEFRSAFRSLTKDVEGPSVDANGRVHPFWSGAHTVTGRVTCSLPNCANVPSTKLDPDSLRSMYVAGPGNVLVCADLEQAELRVVALLARDEVWLRVFASGDDVHVLNAMDFYDLPREQITKSLRTFSKTAAYMFLYGGGAHKALQQMRRVQDPITKVRPYARMTLEEATLLRKRLLGAHRLENWWRESIDDFHVQGYRREPVLGRIRRFLDSQGGEDEESMNEIVNFSVQSSIAGIVSGANACGRLMDSIGWPWTSARGLGGAGIIHNGYDSLMVEVAESRADEAKAALEAAMNTTVEYQGRSIAIPAKAKVGRRWSEV